MQDFFVSMFASRSHQSCLFILACVQNLQSVRRSEKEKKAPCRVCTTVTNSVFRVFIFCGTVWDWLNELTVVLTCVQRILRVTNFVLKFVTSKNTMNMMVFGKFVGGNYYTTSVSNEYRAEERVTEQLDFLQ